MREALPWLLLLLATARGEGEPVAGEGIRAELEEVLDGMAGRRHIQQTFDERGSYSHQTPDWIQKTSELATKIGAIFEKHFNVVKKTKEAIVNSHKNFSFQSSAAFKNLNVERCCEIDESKLEYVKELGKKGDVHKPCFRKARNESDFRVRVPVSEQLIKTMKDNRDLFGTDSSGMKWLYYGEEDGVSVHFPGSYDSHGCIRYDPRVRPWYAVTATPEPKDIVIVIDKSGSTNQNGYKEIINKAASTVIDTLNPEDRVGVVYFSDAAKKPDFCHRNYLAYAIPKNRRELKADIEKVPARGGSRYIEGLEEAFTLLKNNNIGMQRKKALLFITSDKADASPQRVLEVLQQQIDAFDDKIIILTYLIGEGDDEATKELLHNMSKLSNDVPSPGADRFTQLINISDIRQDIGRYYRFFKPTNSTEPVVTVPYVDYSQLGLILSICLPVYYARSSQEQERLQGVTCIDMTISDLAINDFDFQQGYMFIFNRNNGQALLHPLLPSPGDQKQYTADPVFLNVTLLEKDADREGILGAMFKGEKGSKTIRTTLITSNGNPVRDGVHEEKVTATYHYEQISGTSFALAIVTTEKDTVIGVTPQQADYPQNFHYCANDRRSPVCSHAGTNASADHGCVYLTNNALKDRSHNDIDIDEIGNYFMNDPNYEEVEHELQPNVRDMVTITLPAEDFWLRNRQNTKYEVQWRYMVTYNGVLRVYPSVNISQNLEYPNMYWYAKVMGDNESALVATAPRYNDFSGSVVISLFSRLIEQGDRTLAILGADVTLASVHALIQRTQPACRPGLNNSCFLMDESGYLVYHDSYNFYAHNGSEMQDIIGGKHITQVEGAIAKDLVEQRNLIKHRCVSLGSKWNHTTWRMAGVQQIDRMQGAGYYMEKVKNSNLYIVLKSASKQQIYKCACDLWGSAESSLGKCSSNPNTVCQCPCYTEIKYYNQCSNELYDPNMTHHIAIPNCTPNKTALFPGKAEWLVNLSEPPVEQPICFPTTCQALGDEWSCSAFAVCTWCGSECTDDRCPEPPAEPVAPVVTIVVVVVVVVLVLALAVGAFFIYRWRQIGKPAGPATFHDDNAVSGGTFLPPRSDDDYQHIPADLDSKASGVYATPPGSLPSQQGAVNNGYLHSPPASHAPPDYDSSWGTHSNDPPGAPSAGKPRIPSCSGHSPSSPPPPVMELPAEPAHPPPGSPDEVYLDTLNAPARPEILPLRTRLNSEMNHFREATIPEDTSLVLNPSTLPHSRRQSVPLPPVPAQPTTRPTSTLPRGLAASGRPNAFVFPGHQAVQPLYGSHDGLVEDEYLTTLPASQAAPAAPAPLPPVSPQTYVLPDSAALGRAMKLSEEGSLPVLSLHEDGFNFQHKRQNSQEVFL